MIEVTVSIAQGMCLGLIFSFVGFIFAVAKKATEKKSTEFPTRFE